MICIDVEEDEVQVCKWDGREIRLERSAGLDATEAVAEGIRRLAPRPGFQLRYRIAEGAASKEEMARRIEELGRGAGAKAIRRLPDDIRAEPGLTAARQAADQHRLGEIVCLDLQRSSFLCAAVDGRGGVTAHERGNPADAEAICAAVSQVKRDAVTLVWYGSASSPAVAVEIARRCGYQQVLIPDYAASLTVVGMLIVDLIFELRADAPTDLADTRGFREGFARMMDEAARQVMLEGYDIDDTICERLVEVADGLVPFDKISAHQPIHALELRVTIHTPKFLLPADGTGRLVSIDG